MSICLTLIHASKIEKLIYPKNILDLEGTNLVEYFIENDIGTELKKNQKLFYSGDIEFKRTTSTTYDGNTIKYIKVSDLDDIPKEILESKKEKHVRKALEYLRTLDGYIILWFT